MMVTVKMNANELRVLRSQLKEDIDTLHMEISHTDQREYREHLRTKEATLRKLVEKLETAA